jgi:prepilin-type N-terminal cleavage/methylation domain-containing protein
MHSRLRRRTLQRGFTLIEILTVLAIIGILAAILIPAVSKAQERSRLTATLAEIRSLKTIVAEAASRLGGTLPLTEGRFDPPGMMRANTGFDPYILPGQVVNTAPLLNRARGVTASRLLRLDHVLTSLKPPLLESTWTTRFGGGVAPASFIQPRLFFNPNTQRFDSASTVAFNYNVVGVNASDDSSNRSRIECAPVVSRAAFNIGNPALADVNVARGINFDLDGNGVIGVNATVCAFVVYKRVTQQDAYRLAVELNGTRLMDNQLPGGVNPQVRGSVIYGAPNAGLVDVYVFLAQF